MRKSNKRCGGRLVQAGAGFEAAFARSCYASAVAEPRVPVAGAAGQQVEEVPDRTEIVARAEPGVGDAQDRAPLALEDRHARQAAAVLALVAHIGGEAGAGVAHHREAPAAPGSEALLPRGRVGARDREGGAVGEVVVDAVEP